MAGFPAALYAIQSLAALFAYQNLDALTFNILNQTKTMSAALCCYFILGRRQSRLQVVALFLLLLSALIMELVLTFDCFHMDLIMAKVETLDAKVGSMDAVHVGESSALQAHRLSHGVAPVLLASFLSGLAGTLCERNLHDKGRDPYFFSMELCVASSIFLMLSLTLAPDGQVIREHGFWSNDWNYKVFIPIVTNAIGGILVGLVTKYAGSVRKGFALIFGMLLSGMLQSESVSPEQVVGGVLAAVSLWMHAIGKEE